MYGVTVQKNTNILESESYSLALFTTPVSYLQYVPVLFCTMALRPHGSRHIDLFRTVQAARGTTDRNGGH